LAEYSFIVITVCQELHFKFYPEDDCLLDVASCSLVDTDQRFTGTYCLHHQIPDELLRKMHQEGAWEAKEIVLNNAS
jgi:hypothetical protein